MALLGAPYIYDISSLRVKGVLAYCPFPRLIEFGGHSLTKNIPDRDILQEEY